MGGKLREQLLLDRNSSGASSMSKHGKRVSISDWKRNKETSNGEMGWQA